MRVSANWRLKPKEAVIAGVTRLRVGCPSFGAEASGVRKYFCYIWPSWLRVGYSWYWRAEALGFVIINLYSSI